MMSSAGKKLARSNVLFLLPNNTIIPHLEYTLNYQQSPSICSIMMKKWVNIDGGPNKLTLAEAKEAYARRKIVKILEFDTVLLKNGQTATIVEKLSEDTFIADIGDSPKDWDTITITINGIEKVVYRNS